MATEDGIEENSLDEPVGETDIVRIVYLNTKIRCSVSIPMWGEIHNDVWPTWLYVNQVHLICLFSATESSDLGIVQPDYSWHR